MQTKIHPSLIDSPIVQEAESILRSCVHCGFCNAVCPTYQILGDELDGPRGRIYLIKNLLEDNAIAIEANQHLDRCLTCRSCETSCPSGVQYGRLIDIARGLIKVKSPWFYRVKSYFIRKIVPQRHLFSTLVTLGRLCLPLIPHVLAKHIPPRVQPSNIPMVSKSDNCEGVLLLTGCVQNIATPNVNQSIAYLLDSLKVDVNYLENEGCCGALEYHLSAHDAGIEKMKKLVLRLHEQLHDNFWIISSASGCGVTIKDYPTILQYETDIIAKAQEVADRVLDIGEYLSRFPNLLSANEAEGCQAEKLKVAVHTPCTLQHGQNLSELIKPLLRAEHIEFVDVKEGHICCGSAGSYSIMQPEISAELTQRKVSALELHKPDTIVTANIGCQLTLQSHSDVRVMHWVEFLAEQVLMTKN